MIYFQAPIQNTHLKMYATKGQFINLEQLANW